MPISFPAFLDGEPYTFINGDLASGCADEESEEFATDPNVSVALPTNVFPNPTADNAVITFTPAVTDRTTVEIFDMTGRPMVSLFSRVAQEGVEYRLNVNTSEYEDGIYIYRIVNGEHTTMKKIIVSR